MPSISEKGYLGLFETGVNTGFEIPEIAEDALFEFLHIPDGPAKGLESKYEGADDVGAGDVVEAVPEDAGDVFGGGEEEAVEGGVGGGGVGRGHGGIGGGCEEGVVVGGVCVGVPSGGSGGEEELESV